MYVSVNCKFLSLSSGPKVNFKDKRSSSLLFESPESVGPIRNGIELCLSDVDIVAGIDFQFIRVEWCTRPGNRGMARQLEVEGGGRVRDSGLVRR